MEVAAQVGTKWAEVVTVWVNLGNKTMFMSQNAVWKAVHAEMHMRK